MDFVLKNGNSFGS